MKFAILIPNAPIDLKTFKPASTDELHAMCPPFSVSVTQTQACDVVRGLQRGAIAMPFPVEIGSGKSVFLGLVAEDTQRRVLDPDKPLPFAVLVQPVPDNDFDRRQLRSAPGDVFDEKIWRVRPERPDIRTSQAVELRSSELAVPMFTDASVGRDSTGRLTLYIEAGDNAISLHFDDKNLQLVDHVDEHGFDEGVLKP